MNFYSLMLYRSLTESYLLITFIFYIVSRSKFGPYLTSSVSLPQSTTMTEPVVSHWKYKLMTGLTIFTNLRPNIAPNEDILRFFFQLLSADILSLKSLAFNALETIIGTYLPKIHYTNKLKKESYPNDNFFNYNNSNLDNTILDNNKKYNLKTAYLSKKNAEQNK